jgi:hypothetical protein
MEVNAALAVRIRPARIEHDEGARNIVEYRLQPTLPLLKLARPVVDHLFETVPVLLDSPVHVLQATTPCG